MRQARRRSGGEPTRADVPTPVQGWPARPIRPMTYSPMLTRRIPHASALLAVIGAAVAVMSTPGPAGASELIARDAKNVRLHVNARGQALVRYTAGEKRTKLLAWGAVDARPPAPDAKQVSFNLDYAAGWGTYRRDVSKGFRNVCKPYRGPTLAWFVAGCTAPDGSHWALQSWQRGLPNLGFEPWQPLQASWELRLSHWSTEPAKLEIWPNWAYSRRFDHLFGRLTYLGQPMYGFGSTAKGSPLDGFGRNIYLDTLNSAYGPGWKRENSFLAHKGTGVFCYGFYEHDPYPGYPATGRRPQGKGERYRATVIGPGVTPDVVWEGTPLGAYDRALDLELHELQRTLYSNDALCKPV